MTVISLHQRVSEELAEAFKAVTDNGFRVHEVKRMTSRLLGKGRYSLVLNVSFLLTAMQCGGLDVEPGGIEKFLFSLSPRTGELSKALIAASDNSDHLTFEGNSLTLTLSGGERFEIDLSRARLRFLLLGVNALAEFGGFEWYRRAKADLNVVNGSREKIRAIASAWSDEIDRELRAKGGGRQAHAKFKQIRGFLAHHIGHERYAAGDVSSEAVLEFWKGHAVKGDWKRYATAHEDLVAFLDTLNVQKSQERADPLGDYVEIGVDYRDDDPDTHDPYLHAMDGDAGSWGSFRKRKEGPSYLTEIDHGRVAPIGDLPAGLETLLKSALRVMKFASVENTVSRKPTAAVLEKALGDVPSYPQVLTGVQKAIGRIESACWASVHALSAGGRPSAIFLLQQMTELGQFQRAFASVAVEAHRSEDPARMLLVHFRASTDPACIELRKRASKAFDETNREGFRTRDVANETGLDSLEEGWPSALGALRHLQDRAAGLPALVGAAAEADDRATFRTVYASIYDIHSTKEPCL